MWYVFFRCLSVLILFVTYALISNKNYYDIFIWFALTHYIVAIYFGSKIAKRVCSSLAGVMLATTIVIVSLAMGYIDWPGVPLFFAVHFALTEAYIWKFKLEGRAESEFQFFRFLLHLLTYLFVAGLIIQYINLFMIFIILLCGVLARYYYKHRRLKKQVFIPMLCFDMVSLLAILTVYSTRNYIDYVHLIFYHVILWIFIPSVVKESVNLKLLKKVLLINLIPVASVLALNYILNFDAHLIKWANALQLPFKTSLELLVFFSYLHINLSYISSAIHPKFWNNITARMSIKA